MAAVQDAAPATFEKSSPTKAKRAMKGDLQTALDAFETLVLEQKAKHAGNAEVRQVLDMLALNYAAV